jgi:hypothetical protein
MPYRYDVDARPDEADLLLKAHKTVEQPPELVGLGIAYHTMHSYD